jgi:CRISPR-associated protein Csx3
MALYNITLDGDLMKVSFGDPASNDAIVRDVSATLDNMKAAGTLRGGSVLKINGPASLPVAFVIAHAVLHIYGAVAVFDPKLQKYVVTVTHSAEYAIGDLID